MAAQAGTFGGGRLYIGGTDAIDFTSDASAITDFEAETWVEINEISNVGDFGVEDNIVQFPVLKDSLARKAKGLGDAGDPAIVVGRLSADPGQVAMRAAKKTKFYYNFKLELADAESASFTNTIIYWRALVAGVPMQFGGVEDFVTETYTLGVFPAPVIDESAVIP